MKMSLWRFAMPIGEWRVVREVRLLDAAEWLSRHQKDEPGVIFALSEGKPKWRRDTRLSCEEQADNDSIDMNIRARDQIKAFTREVMASREQILAMFAKDDEERQGSASGRV